jgi:hypothetical protein
MALPTFWQLLLPNLNGATIIGIIFLLIAIFGRPLLNLLGTIIKTITGGKVDESIISSFFIVAGIILIWGVSIVQDFANSSEAILITGVVLIIIAILIFALRTKDNEGVFK